MERLTKDFFKLSTQITSSYAKFTYCTRGRSRRTQGFIFQMNIVVKCLSLSHEEDVTMVLNFGLDNNLSLVR